MQSKTWGLIFFALGIISMHVFMTLNFWLNVIGIVPVNTWYGIIPANSLMAGLIWGLSPPIGAVLMVLGGLVYGRKTKEASR